ncbi:MAG: hemolysin family protein [Actinomycetales bacterium]|nr:hemolysin family protein [Actinomycetales bacterium]
MGDIWADLLIILVLILVGGCFVAAELAIVSLRDSQVTRLAEEGGRRGRRLKSLAAFPNRFLAAGQIGVTLTGFLSAAFGESRISPQIVPILVGWGVSDGLAEVLVLLLVTSVVAYFSLVLGELVPKRIALQRAERLALFAAGPLDAFATMLRPVIALLSVSTDFVVRLFGVDPKARREQISGEELRDLVAAHEDLTVEERELIDDVFEAGDRELREVMIPRTEVDFLDASMPVFKAAGFVADRPHSRYPVIRDSADDVIGFVHIRDILAPGLAERSIRVGELAREAAAFPGTNGVLSTLTEMRRRGVHLAIVVDEYGGTAGIVTMEDLVEELIGDIKDEYDEVRKPAAARTYGVTVVDGLMNLEDFAEEAGFELPDGPYETVAGFVVARLGHLPEVGESVSEDGHRIEVTELDGRRIARVRVTPLPPLPE